MSVFRDVETKLPDSFPVLKMNKIQSQVQSKNSLHHTIALPIIHCKSKCLTELSIAQDQVGHAAVHAGTYCWLQSVLEFSIGMAVQLKHLSFPTDSLVNYFAPVQRTLQFQNSHLFLLEHMSGKPQSLAFLIQFPDQSFFSGKYQHPTDIAPAFPMLRLSKDDFRFQNLVRCQSTYRMTSRKFYTGFPWRQNDQRLSKIRRTEMFAPIDMPILDRLHTFLENFDFCP